MQEVKTDMVAMLDSANCGQSGTCTLDQLPIDQQIDIEFFQISQQRQKLERITNKLSRQLVEDQLNVHGQKQ